MKINIASIKKERISKYFFFHLPVNGIMPDGLVAPFYGEVTVEGKISNVGDMLLLEGEAAARIRGECARCLEPLDEMINISLCEEFFFATAQNIKEDAYVYEGDFVDIKPLISDNLILGQPMRMLCKNDCQGLCPFCGQNLNITACGCEKNTIDPRLAALKRLKDGE